MKTVSMYLFLQLWINLKPFQAKLFKGGHTEIMFHCDNIQHNIKHQKNSMKPHMSIVGCNLTCQDEHREKIIIS